MTSRNLTVTTRNAGLFSQRPTQLNTARFAAANAGAVDLKTATTDELRTYRLSVLAGLRQTLNKGTIAADMGTTLQNQLALFSRIEDTLAKHGQAVTNDVDAQDLLDQVKAVVPPVPTTHSA